ncbi:MAG: glycosyltransferase family 2 protein [Paludibacteraceae bacterium]|nr:glycosyltransferase family 2 protein [Paludibacteraceae bacterium]
MIRYTVIVPHYESLDVLPRAIESVPERDDVEVLVVDNSPKPIDTTLFRTRKNVRILYSPCGKGAGAARNVGLEHAQGKWLMMLDADDFFVPNAFETIDRYADEEADIVFFHATSCDSDTFVPSQRMDETNRLIDRYLQTGDESALRYGWSSPCAKMIRRDFIKEHGIRFEETHAANDVIFSLQTGHYAKHIAASADTVYCATVRQGSLTTTPSLENIRERIDVFCRFNKMASAFGAKEHRKSIMFYILEIKRHYGILTALKVLFHTIRIGNNPFIGCSRWLTTSRKQRQHEDCNH